jgi:DNA-binding NtrC family response regulator
MQKRILVVDAVRKQCRQLCTLLKKRGYPATPIHSILTLEKCLAQGEYLSVILDIDTVPVDNHMIRELTIKNPGVNFFALSAYRFHPKLKDAICYHIYACINKPVEPEELFYWLRCIYEEQVG